MDVEQLSCLDLINEEYTVSDSDSDSDSDSEYSLEYIEQILPKNINNNIFKEYEFKNSSQSRLKVKIIYFRIPYTETELHDLKVHQKFNFLNNIIAITLNGNIVSFLLPLYEMLINQIFYGNEIIYRESDVLIPIYCNEQETFPIYSLKITIYNKNYETFNEEKHLDTNKLFLIKWKNGIVKKNDMLSTFKVSIHNVIVKLKMLKSDGYVSKFEINDNYFNICFCSFVYIPVDCSGDDDYYLNVQCPTNINFDINGTILNFEESEIFQLNFFGIKSYFVSLCSSTKNFEQISKLLQGKKKFLRIYQDEVLKIIDEDFPIKNVVRSSFITITTEQQIKDYNLCCSFYYY